MSRLATLWLLGLRRAPSNVVKQVHGACERTKITRKRSAPEIHAVRSFAQMVEKRPTPQHAPRGIVTVGRTPTRVQHTCMDRHLTLTRSSEPVLPVMDTARKAQKGPHLRRRQPTLFARTALFAQALRR
jgi:hypothetical protein